MKNSREKIEVIGFVISVVTTIVGFFGLTACFSPTLLSVTILMSMVSYLLCGGIIYAIKATMKVTKVAWLVVPIFPYDIITGALGFTFGVYMLLLAPAFFTGKKLYDNRKNQVQIYNAQ